MRFSAVKAREAFAQSMTERGKNGLQERVRRIVLEHGRLIEPVFFYHTWSSVKSEPGYPDCTIVLPRQGRLIYAELKRQRAKLSDAQEKWLQALATTRAEVYIWKPLDMIRGHIAAALRHPQGIEEGRIWPGDINSST